MSDLQFQFTQILKLQSNHSISNKANENLSYRRIGDINNIAYDFRLFQWWYNMCSTNGIKITQRYKIIDIIFTGCKYLHVNFVELFAICFAFIHDRHSIDYMAKYGEMVSRRALNQTNEWKIGENKRIFYLSAWIELCVSWWWSNNKITKLENLTFFSRCPHSRMFHFNANHIFLSVHIRVLSDFCSFCMWNIGTSKCQLFFSSFSSSFSFCFRISPRFWFNFSNRLNNARVRVCFDFHLIYPSLSMGFIFDAIANLAL